ncbi:MAG: heme ABC exporter ATP-binding protein CcmA [Actinomycetota bacterium]
MRVSARGISRRYGRVRALSCVDLEIAPGERVAIFGANGSGKTTLLKIVAGLLAPSSGEVAIDGAAPRMVRGRFGYLGHHPYLYPHLSVIENLALFARLYGVRGAAAEAALARMGLSTRRHALVHTLSRGETQRAALARCILHDPPLLLMDEPFTGLDEEAAETLPGILRQGGRTLVMATHDHARGEAVADRTVTLEHGCLRG